MDWRQDVLAIVAGFAIAVVTTPVGVSGAVFLLPVQLDLFRVPNPQVTPTNLIYNVIAGPGALVRYAQQRQLAGPLTVWLIAGAAPGVVVGAVLRVYVADDPTVFRLIAAAVLLPTGIFILARDRFVSPHPRQAHEIAPRLMTTLAFVVGVVGGIYGIGGGSILGPILVGTGMSVAVVAPAALASTFVTSVVGVAAYAVLALNAPGTIAPDWELGISCGVGGLLGGYVGARAQPHLPEKGLRTLLGLLAVGLSLAYLAQALR